MSFGRKCLDEWPLDADVTYLNHGTVGVTPLSVLSVQQAFKARAERAPAQFLLREQARLTGSASEGPSLVRQAAAEVAAFIGARSEDLVFVDNATTGVNAVLRSVPLEPGDEVLLTGHAYGAVANAARFITAQKGARVQVVPVPYPRYDPVALVAAVAAAMTSRTRVAVFDHISAESALVLPVRELASVCRARGVRVLIDGAHAPGVLSLDVASLGVDWYAANLHKWACAPRSCGFLWASPSAQAGLHAPVISWGLDQGFAAEFDWVGTRDVSAWLAAPAGIRFLEDKGLQEIRAYNHGLAWEGAMLLAEEWGTQIPAAESDVAFMATVPVPESLGGDGADAARLRDQLLFEHRIEVQVHAGGGRVWTRISAQIYNDIDDVARLARAVRAMAGRSAA